MAVFNPDVPNTQDPNYLNYSKVVDAPPPDKTAGIALATIGEGIEGVARVGDAITKGIINDKVREQVEVERAIHTAYLEKIRENQQAGIIPKGSPAGSLLGTDDEGASAPEALESSLSRADTIASARAQGANRINDTYYTMNLNSLAKKLRNEYPGYKDYIDERFSKISGMDPANAYYKNLMEDINRNMKVQQTPETQAVKMGYELMKNGSVPGLYPYIQAVEAGLPNAATNLFNYVNDWQSTKARADKAQRDRTEIRGRREDNAMDARDAWNKEFQDQTAMALSTPFNIAGLNEPTTVMRILSDSSQGKLTLSPEQWDALQVRVNAIRTQLVQHGKTLYNTRDYAQTWNNPKQMEEDLKSQLLVADTLVDAIKSKDTGTMFEVERRIKARKDGAEDEALSGPLSGWLLTNNFIKNAGGDILVSQLNRDLLSSDLFPKYRSTLNTMIQRSMVPDSVRKDGIAKSLFRDVKTLQDKNIGPQTRVYDRLFDNIQRIKDPNIPDTLKAEIIDYAFKPENRELLDKFRADYTDPNTGKYIPGKQSIFVRLTSPDITDNVAKIAKGNPLLWSQYKDWAEVSFAKLFREDIQTLNEIQETRLRLGWNADKRQLELRDDRGQPLQGLPPTPSIMQAQRTIRSLNFGLSNLANVQDKEGSDTAAYLVNIMTTLGFRPGEKVSGLPQQLMDNIANSKKTTKQRFEESFK